MTQNSPSWGSRIGGLVRRRRRDLGLTQAALAKRAGVSRPLVGGLEAGLRPEPSNETIRKLAAALEWPELLHVLDVPTVADASTLLVASGLLEQGGRQARAAGKEARTGAGTVWAYAGQPRRPFLEWAACGVPTPTEGVMLDWQDELMDTIALPERSDEALRLIGPQGFAVGVRGQSMTRWGLNDGDVVWVNPDRGRIYGLNRPVLARMTDVDGEDLGMVVKVLKVDDENVEYLSSDGDEGDNHVRYYSFEFVAPCVWWQPRGGTLVRRAERAEMGEMGTAARRYEGAERLLDEVTGLVDSV